MTTDPTSANPSLEKVWNQVKGGEKVGTENIKGLYDNWTSSYDEDLRKHRYYGPSNAGSTFAEHRPEKGAHILDIGCGTGLVGEHLHSLGYTDIVGVDISQKSLDVADKKGVYKRLVCAEVGKDKLPFDNNEFDGLVCCGCMLPNHFRPGCLLEWVRVVRPAVENKGAVSVFTRYDRTVILTACDLSRKSIRMSPVKHFLFLNENHTYDKMVCDFCQSGIIALVMRKSYVEVVEGEENFLLKDYQLEFDEVTQSLERSKSWKMVSKKVFPCYYDDSPGLAIVWKIL